MLVPIHGALARLKPAFAADGTVTAGTASGINDGASALTIVVRPGSSGTPVPGYEARLVDENGEQVATGEIGSLLVEGDSTCAFYRNRHELTKATIEGHWIRTGDRYYRDADGYYWFAGRSDDMLKVGGLWVSPAELEHVLVEHPAVLSCGVVGRPDRDGLIKPLACVVARTGVDATPELASELQQFARTRLAEYKRPRWVEFVDALPTTATGKVQRFKLRERGDRGQSP
jgi:benzoate-CoA ligase